MRKPLHLSVVETAVGEPLALGGSLGFTLFRGTHAENEGLLTGVEGSLVALSDRLGRGEARGTATATSAGARVTVLRGELALIRQRIVDEDYDFTGQYTVDGINGRLKRMKDEVDGLVASVTRTVQEPKGSATQAATDRRESALVQTKTVVQTKDEKDRTTSAFALFMEKYGTYVKVGGGLVALGLVAYAFGPLVRGLGSRVASSEKGGGS